MRNIAILLASGSGTRFGGDTPKQFLKLNNKYVFEYSLKTFNENLAIDEIILVVRNDYLDVVKKVIKDKKYSKVIRIIAGGETRQESVFNGIFTIGVEEANVIIHDSARPFVTPDMIERVVGALQNYSAVSTILPTSDTIFTVDEIERVVAIPNRSSLKRVQTPQGFYLNTLKKAHFMAQKENLNLATDDCTLIKHYNLGQIAVVKGDELAFKITSPLDLIFAQAIVDNFATINSD